MLGGLFVGSSPKKEEDQTASGNSITNNNLQNGGATSGEFASEENAILNPYMQEAKDTSVDLNKLHPMAGLDKGLEFLDLEEEQLDQLPGAQGALPSRGWSDDLYYGTGTTYLVGLGVGGGYGMMEGLRQIQPNSPSRLKLNGVLNAVTRRGPFVGNSAGVLALGYNTINSMIGYYRGRHEDSNSIAAGFLSGALFRSTRGLRPMAISSILMGTAAGAWCLLKRAVL